MSDIKEYIGCRSIEATDGRGTTFYNNWLTDEEIIRCRDCGMSHEDGWKCARWVTGTWDEEMEADVIELADVRPDGYCFMATRRES